MNMFDSFMSALSTTIVLGITTTSTIVTFKIYTSLPAMVPVFVVQQWIIYAAIAITITSSLMCVAGLAYLHKVFEPKPTDKTTKQQSNKNTGE